MKSVESDEVFKSWVRTELYGGVVKGGNIEYGFKDMYDLANNGDLSEGGWKRLILHIKAIRGLYLIPDIAAGVVEVNWYKTQLSLEDLKQCNNWEYVNLENSVSRYQSEDFVHNVKVKNTANRFKYSWPDEPIIFTCEDIDDFKTYRLIDGNHRARRYISENRSEPIESFVCVYKK